MSRSRDGVEGSVMAISLPDARLLSDEVLEALRLRAVHGCALGYTEAEIAELLGVARETVCRWCCAYDTGGREALPHDRTGRPPGLGRLLSDAQATHVQEFLDRHVRVNQISTITNTGEVHFMTYTGTMTAARFLTFLERLLRGTAGKLIV